MFIIAQYKINLNIDSSCIAFYESFDINLLSRLRELYEGSCAYGCLIVRIHQVLRVGECQFISATDPCRGTIAVSFSARVVQYAPGDIIGGCISRESSSDRIPALTPLYAELIFARDTEAGTRDEALRVIGVGAALIGSARVTCANPGANRVSIQAALYEPINIVRYWPISRIASDIQWIPQYWVPAEFRDGEDSAVCNIYDYLREFVAIWARESAAINAKIPKFAQYVSRLFVARTSEYETDNSIASKSILDVKVESLSNAAAIAIYPGDDPFSCTVRIVSQGTPIPAEWTRARPYQPRDAIITQIAEYFADIHIAAIETLNALTDPKCAQATKALIATQMSRKK